MNKSIYDLYRFYNLNKPWKVENMNFQFLSSLFAAPNFKKPCFTQSFYAQVNLTKNRTKRNITFSEEILNGMQPNLNFRNFDTQTHLLITLTSKSTGSYQYIKASIIIFSVQKYGKKNLLG
jgi:hypothetical protein